MNANIFTPKTLLICIAMSCMLITNVCLAAPCVPDPSWNPKNVYFKFPAEVIVRNDAAVGDVLAEAEEDIVSAETYVGNCPGPGYVGLTFDYTPTGTIMSGMINKTNIPGIGIKIESLYTRGSINVPDNEWRTLTGAFPLGTGDIFRTPNNAYLTNLKVKASLIKTQSNVGQGFLPNTDVYGVMTLSLQGGSALFAPIVNFRVNGTQIKKPSCTVSSGKDIIVDFKDIYIKNAGLINGGVPGTEKEFNIQLNCNETSKISIMYNSDYKDDVLHSSIKNQGSAKGIYINFLDIGRLGNYNTITTSSQGTEIIRQKVQLYRSGTFVAGSISGSATYTLNYE